MSSEASSFPHDPANYEAFQQVVPTPLPDGMMPDSSPEDLSGVTFAFPSDVRDVTGLSDFFGWLRQVREGATPLSQYGIAAAMGTSQSAISAIEHGRTDVRLTTLLWYLQTLGWGVTLVLTAPQERQDHVD